jgi:hypothetical protein
MAVISNYSTLQQAVSDYLAKSDLTTFVPNFIQNAENKLYRRLNLRNEETSMSISVASGVGAVPADFKALKFAYVNETPVTLLEWMPIEQLYTKYPVRSGSNTPNYISRDGTNFVFGPDAKDFTMAGIYYAKQDPLRTTDLSWYVVNAPELLLYGSLLEAEPFIKNDDRIPVWREFYNNAVDTIRDEQRAAERSKQKLSALG